MSYLHLAKAAEKAVVTNKPALLYKSIMREVPRIMQLYDIMEKPEQQVKDAIRSHFYKHKDLKDERVIDMLLDRGYYDLEDTLLQHKQKNHLMFLLEGFNGYDMTQKNPTKTSSLEAQFARHW